MSKLKLQHWVIPLAQDMYMVLLRSHLRLEDLKAGTSGLVGMHKLLTIVSRNRAYDDTHPSFAAGLWVRMLPYDGRAYTFFYEGDANDDHVASLLHAVKHMLKEWQELPTLPQWACERATELRD